MNKQRLPLTDNTLVEQELGKYGMICVEDLIHEIYTVVRPTHPPTHPPTSQSLFRRSLLFLLMSSSSSHQPTHLFHRAPTSSKPRTSFGLSSSPPPRYVSYPPTHPPTPPHPPSPWHPAAHSNRLPVLYPPSQVPQTHSSSIEPPRPPLSSHQPTHPPTQPPTHPPLPQ